MSKSRERGAYFKIKKPKWTWERIGGLRDVKERLEEMVSLPLRIPEVFEKAGLNPPSGVLLWGPPGGGKTVLAEAAANSAGSNYISVKAIEILSEPEEIGVMYDTAIELAPCVVFINEVDALAPKRGAKSAWSAGITRDAPLRIAPEETTEIFYRHLDKVANRKDVVTIGGTYRPDVLDDRIRKKGRLEKKIYVPPPNYEDRLEIFQIQLRGTPLAEDVSLEELAEKTEYYVGADIRGVVREAKIIAIKEKGENFDCVEARHFEEALRRIPPYLSPEAAKKYEDTYAAECDHCYLF
jgi:transitional endoplasmic reticulum ATPase